VAWKRAVTGKEVVLVFYSVAINRLRRPRKTTTLAKAAEGKEEEFIKTKGRYEKKGRPLGRIGKTTAATLAEILFSRTLVKRGKKGSKR